MNATDHLVPTDAQIVAELLAYKAELQAAWDRNEAAALPQLRALNKVLNRAQARADEALPRFTVNGDDWFVVPTE